MWEERPCEGNSIVGCAKVTPALPSSNILSCWAKVNPLREGATGVTHVAGLSAPD